MSDRLLTTKETADYLKVHWQTARSYIKKGVLKASKVGKNIRIRESDIQKVLDKEKKKPIHEIEIRFASENRKKIEARLLDINAKIIYHGHIIDHWYAPNYIKTYRRKINFMKAERTVSISIQTMRRHQHFSPISSLPSLRTGHSPLRNYSCIAHIPSSVRHQPTISSV